MKHRHLNHEGYTLAAIDDIISRGAGNDWIDLGLALKRNPVEIIHKILKVSEHRISNPYEQSYRFWHSYATAKLKELNSENNT